MSAQDKTEYKTTVPNEHWREEEYQWARILATGHAAKGMVLLYIQKACTAFHEFEPAWKEGAVEQGHIEFLRKRMANRIRHVLVTMGNNGLDTINGADELREILNAVESAETEEELAEITERLHMANHVLLDSLEAD
ncbi:MAG: hypothetical protein ACYS8Z_12650 [Planctomycetota bacterium]|jgi:hypothetical protein